MVKSYRTPIVDALKKSIKFMTIMMLVAVPLVFSTRFYDAFIIPKLVLFRCLLLLMLPGAIYIVIAEKRKIWLAPIGISLLLHFLIIFISSLFSISWYISSKKVIELLSFMGIYWIWYVSLDKNDWLIYLKAITFAGFFSALYALLQHIGIDIINIDWTQSSLIKMRSISTIGNPAFLAGFLVIVLPIPLFLLISGNGLFFKDIYWRKINISHILSKFIYAIIWCTCFIALILTYTRGAWIAFLLSNCLFVIMSWKIIFLKYKKALFIAIALFFISIGFALLYDRLKDQRYEWHTFANRLNTIRDSGSLYESRFFLWKAAGMIFRDHMFIGTGPGTFSYIYLKYRNNEPMTRRKANEYMGSCHNEFLEIASTTGIFGLLAFCGIIVNVLYIGFILFRASPEKHRIFLLSILSCCIAYIVHIFTLFPTISSEIIWWFYIALISVEYNSVQKGGIYNSIKEGKQLIRKKTRAQYTVLVTPIQYALISVTIVFSLILIIYSCRIAFGNVCLNFAKKAEAEKMWGEAEAYYNKAIELDPQNHSNYLYKACALETMLKEDSFKSSYADEVIKCYMTAISINSIDPYQWVNLGRFYQYIAENIDRKTAPLAEMAYQKAISLDPYNYLNYNYLATLYMNMAINEKALECFNKSIAVYPSSLVYFNMGVMYWNQKNVSSAKECFQKALIITPTYDKAKLALKTVENFEIKLK